MNVEEREHMAKRQLTTDGLLLRPTSVVRSTPRGDKSDMTAISPLPEGDKLQTREITKGKCERTTRREGESAKERGSTPLRTSRRPLSAEVSDGHNSFDGRSTEAPFGAQLQYAASHPTR